MLREKIKNAKRIAVKVGTSTLTYDTGMLNIRRIELLARTLADIHHEGRDIVLISSGAVAVGMGKLGKKERPVCIKEKQALSSVGQGELIGIYSKLFAEYSCDVSQVLLTRDVVEMEKRRENAINTFNMLFSWNVIPIVNENDTISSDELEFGDNDTLSAIVAEITNADLLVVLSDIDGLYNKDPHTHKDAALISEISEITDDLVNLAGGAGTKRGTGGMVTKLAAADTALKAGIDMVIANGKDPKILYDILDGKKIGTFFCAEKGW